MGHLWDIIRQLSSAISILCVHWFYPARVSHGNHKPLHGGLPREPWHSLEGQLNTILLKAYQQATLARALYQLQERPALNRRGIPVWTAHLYYS